MKKIFAIISIMTLCYAMQAQDITSYSFAATSGTYNAISGTTVNFATGSSPYLDEGYFNSIPIGFTFVFEGANYTHVGVSTNGWMTLGNGSTNISSSALSNNINSGTARPMISPLWDDNAMTTNNSDVQYTSTGTTPNRIFTLQWSNVKWNYNATGTVMNFQIKLYESNYKIDFVYNQGGTAANSSSASIGIGGLTSGKYLSVNGVTTSATASSSSETTSIATKPATGITFTFTPPTCLPPTAVTSSAITTTTATISWTAASPVPGSGYQYEVRTSGTAGSGATGLVTSGTTAAGVVTKNITGLTAKTTYYVYVKSDCGASNYSVWTSSYSFTTLKIEPTNQPTSFAAGSVTTSAIPLTWTAAVAGSQLPDGYLVKLSTVDLATVANPVDGTDPVDVTTITANAANKKVTPGTAASATTFSGMTEGTMYYYKIFSYTNSGTGINFNTTSAPTLYHATKPIAITSATLTPTSSGTANITWSNSGYVGANWQTLVFVKAASSVTLGTPTNNPTLYTANTAFGSGDAYQGDAAAYCVYNGDGTSVSITGLSANTTYHVAVYTVVAAANSNSTNSYSSVATANGTTPCVAITSLPHTEPFTSYLPNTCWMEGDAGDITVGPTTISSSASSWAADDFINSTGTTTGAARINIDATGDNDWIISPQFTLPATPNQRLKYSVGATQYSSTLAPSVAWESDDYVQVLISTTAYTSWTVLKTYDNTNTPSHLGQTDILNLSAYSGQTIRIAYRGVEGTTNGSADIDFFIDNFIIETVPTCIEPITVTSSAITSTTATISWTAPSPAPGSGYQYEIRTSGTAGSGATGLTTSGTTAAGVVTTNITGLTATTTYYVYVRSDCGSSNYSAWTTSSSFTTPCTAADIAYTQDFETITAPAIPVCNSIENAGTGNNWATVSNPGYGFTSKTLIYPYHSSNNANAWYYTQGLNLTSGTTYRLTFRYGNAGGSTYPEKLKVKYGTSAANGSMTTLLFDNSNVINDTPITQVVDFTPSSSGVFYIGFNSYSDAYMFNLYIDDITVTTPCIQPVTQASINAFTNNITGTSLTANWSRGSGTNILVVARLTSVSAVVPNSGTTYTANATYGSGDATGTGNYVVYNGSGINVNVTGLTESSSYTFDIYEYNTIGTCYKVPASSLEVVTPCSGVSTPSVTSPVNTCQNTATLSATGSNLYWYNVPSGGSSLGTGNSYNATFNGNTTYYVASQSGASGSNYNVGKAAWDAADGYYGTDDWGVCFTTSQTLTVNTVDVYVQTAGSDVSVQFTDGSGVAVGSVLTFTGLPAGKNTIALNTTLSTPGNYRLYSKNSTNLGRGSTNVSFPYTQSGVMSVTSSWWGDVYTSSNYFFYNFGITTGGGTCQSARVPIVVNHTAEEIVITPSGATTFDQGGSVDLTASSTQTPAYNFTWVPTAGLNTTSGANVTATPTTSTTYTVTGNNGSCTRTATIDINVILPCTGLGTGVTSISSLPFSITGQTTTGKVDDITSSNAIVCSSSSYYEDPDVVYVFKPLVSGSVTITLMSASTWSGIMLYKGCPMNGQGGICASISQSSTGDKSMCVNVEANENYYLVIDSYNSNDYIDYALSISAPNPGSTPNDLPCDAASVSLGGIVSGDNSCASGTGEPTTPSCWSSTGNINTLWYSIVAPASGSLKIRTLLGSLTNTQIALYQGACNTLSLVTNGCNDDFTICSITSKQSDLSLTGLTPGATYYLAVDGYGDEIGTFSVMAIDGGNSWAPVPQQDCSSATVICNQNTDVGNPGFVGSGNVCDYPSGYGCLSSGEKNSAWYTINILSDGNFTFTITPVNSSTDYDWGLFEVTGISNPCSVINSDSEAPLIRCSYAAGGGATGLNATAVDQSEDSGGDKWCQQVAVQAGDILMLNISNFSSNNSGFNLNMEASPVNYNQPASVTWTGATDTDWFKSANWGGCAIPSCTIDAVIVNGPTNQPIINAPGAACKNLQVINGASLTINAGRNLQMCGNFENLGVLNIDPTASITMDNGSTVQALNGSLTGTNKLGNLVVNKTGGEVTANQNVEIGGSLTTSSATSIFNSNGKAIIVGGNIVLNSPSTYANVGSGSLEFNGTSAQSYSPNGALTLNNVEMHNTSTGVTLNNDLTLGTSGTLQLNSGVIHTGSNKVTLLNTDPDATNIGSATSYINGNMRRHLISNTGVYAFPVGTATAYRLAQLTNNSLTGVSYIDSKFASTFTNTGSLNGTIAVDFGTPYASLATEGIWTLTPDAQPSGGSYGINLWFDGGGSNAFSGLADNAFGPLKRADGQTVASVWSSQGGSLESSAGRLVADGYARRDGWNSFSEFGIGKASGSLPVVLLNTQLICNGHNKVISWSTASELNNDYFTILSSTNAVDFTEIARIDGAGNSNGALNYQWTDSTMDNDNHIYYQLQQTDYDGRIKSLSLLSGNCDEGSDNEIIIISNPSNPNIEARFNGDKSGKYSISVINYLGQVVVQKEVDIDTEGNVVLVPKKGLATGVYNLVFRNKTEVITKQVLVTY